MPIICLIKLSAVLETHNETNKEMTFSYLLSQFWKKKERKGGGGGACFTQPHFYGVLKSGSLLVINKMGCFGESFCKGPNYLVISFSVLFRMLHFRFLRFPNDKNLYDYF